MTTQSPREIAQKVLDDPFTSETDFENILSRAVVEIDPQRLRSIANLLTRSPYVGAASMVNDLRRYAAIIDGSAPAYRRRGDDRVSLIPREFWREVPCGHPSDPVAARDGDGHATCHCGNILDGVSPIREVDVQGMRFPLVFCGKCGCHVAIPPVAAQEGQET